MILPITPISHQAAEHSLGTAGLTIATSAVCYCLHCHPGQFLLFSSQTDGPPTVLCRVLQGLQGKKDGLAVIWFGSSTFVPNLRDCLAKRLPQIFCSLALIFHLYSQQQCCKYLLFVFLRLVTFMCFVGIYR